MFFKGAIILWRSTMDLEKFKPMIKKHEGLRLKPYHCTAGKLTIGYGRNLDDRGITEEEADRLLHNDILLCSLQLDRDLPWWKHHPEKVQMVLMDMCFNLGIAGLLEFKRTLGYIRDQKYSVAAVEMLKSKWASQVGSRAKELSVLIQEAKK
jgi:lysozyme